MSQNLCLGRVAMTHGTGDKSLAKHLLYVKKGARLSVFTLSAIGRQGIGIKSQIGIGFAKHLLLMAGLQPGLGS